MLVRGANRCPSAPRSARWAACQTDQPDRGLSDPGLVESSRLGRRGGSTVRLEEDAMRARITLQITADDGTPGTVEEVALLTEAIEGAEARGRRTSACRARRARRCSAPSSGASSGPRSRPGRRVGVAAGGAADGGGPRAARRSRSAPCFGDVPLGPPAAAPLRVRGRQRPGDLLAPDRAPARPRRARAAVPGGPARASLAPYGAAAAMMETCCGSAPGGTRWPCASMRRARAPEPGAPGDLEGAVSSPRAFSRGAGADAIRVRFTPRRPADGSPRALGR